MTADSHLRPPADGGIRFRTAPAPARRSAVERTCLEYKTLRNYAWVARSSQPGDSLLPQTPMATRDHKLVWACLTGAGSVPRAVVVAGR
jgi:hypothetical protein